MVTGGTGLLGTHVLVELSKRGKKIRALKRPSSDLDLVLRVFQFYNSEKGKAWFDQIEWVDGDLNDISSLEDAMKGCDVVYHCAAIVSFIKKDFKKLMKVNAEGTANVVNVALDQGVDHLVYCSSTAAIGRNDKDEVLDETNKWVPHKENSNYAVSKFTAEKEVWRGVEEGLDAVIVNPSVILGVGNWNDSSISIFKVVKKGLKFYTPGANAFVDARDVAFVMSELSERRIFNQRFLCFSENLKFKEVFDYIAEAFQVKPPSILVSEWMAALAWRIEGTLRVLFGRKQNITKETARSAMKTTRFSNQKIKDANGVKFIPIKQSIQEASIFWK
mgnify:CR=1 FL=1